MKTTLLSTVTMLFSIFTLTAQEINPIRMGQYFEQGYGRATDDWADEESALDVIQSPTGLVMTGWIGNEQTGKNAALWAIDDLGRQTLFGDYGSSTKDEIGASVALATDGHAVIVGRETDSYSDDDHSTISLGDNIFMACINSMGSQVWKTVLDSNDTSQVAIDVINDGNNNFIVLANRMYGESVYDMRIMKIALNGSILWDTRHALVDQNIFGQKIHDMNNGHYLILANDIDGQHPMLYEIDGTTGAYEAHEEYPQSNSTICYGFTENAQGYYLAGEQNNGSDNDGFILHVNMNLTEGNNQIETNPTSGNEGYRDIVAHTNGLVAVGTCDNLGEGNQDVWVVHYSSLVVAEKVETLGGEETDYAHSMVLVPAVHSAFVAGYNNSYSIEESGNAYLGGIKVDNGLPESGPCVIPRVLQADLLGGRLGNGNIVPKILHPSNSGPANNLITYMVNNKIKYITMFRLGYIFDGLGNSADKLAYQKLLDNFILNCKTNGIICGYAADRDYTALGNVANYNVQKHNNQRSGKIHFVKLEHEYWNAYNDPYLNSTRAGTPEPTKIAANKSLIDAYYQELHSDHINLITDLNTHKTNNANMWQVYDYIAKLYLESVSTSECSYTKSDYQGRKDKAQDLDGLSDAIFLAYYQHYNAGGGTDFLDPSSTNGSVVEWRRRLSYFGNSSTDKTNVIPLYSTEDETHCGGYPFLGHVLEGSPYNKTENLNSIEGDYNTQHSSIYNSTDPSYAQVKNTSLAAYGWFKYACIFGKTFSNTAQHLCSNLGFVYDPLATSEVDELSDFKIFPNPSSTSAKIVSDKIGIKRLKIINGIGKLISDKPMNGENSTIIEVNTAGIYFIQCVMEDNSVRNIRFIKQ